MPNELDGDLLERFVRGDADAFESLFSSSRWRCIAMFPEWLLLLAYHL